MKALIVMQMRYLINLKLVVIIISSLSLLSFLQLGRFIYSVNVYELEGFSIDFFMYSLGGWQIPMSILAVLNWVVMILIFMTSSQVLGSSLDNMDDMIFPRLNNRIKWWLANCLSQLLLCVMLVLLLVGLNILLASVFFRNEWSWGTYIVEFYKEWVHLGISPVQIILYLVMILFSGLYAIMLSLQTLLLKVSNKLSVFIGMSVILLATGFAYVLGGIQRIFSPIFYASTLSLSPDKYSIYSTLAINILICLLLIIIGAYLIRRKEVSKSVA